MKLEYAIKYLSEKFPEINEELIIFFLTNPNCYISGRLPYRLRKVERINSLFDRFLYPSDGIHRMYFNS